MRPQRGIGPARFILGGALGLCLQFFLLCGAFFLVNNAPVRYPPPPPARSPMLKVQQVVEEDAAKSLNVPMVITVSTVCCCNDSGGFQNAGAPAPPRLATSE